MSDVNPILEFFASENKGSIHREDIYWRCDGEFASITFFVNCNDLFYWGCADGEEITVESLPVLKQAFEDCEKAVKWGRLWAMQLYCCRMRKMRPQGCCYPKQKELWPLVDACGPERETGFGNPYPPGERPDYGKKVTVRGLKEAIELTSKANKMDLEDFARMVYEHAEMPYDQKVVDEFKFTGLSNEDFLRFEYYKDPERAIEDRSKT